MSAASSSGAIAQAAGSNAAEQSSGRGTVATQRTIRRPTAMTRNGIRQFVETEHGVRLFLQYALRGFSFCSHPHCVIYRNCVATINLQTKPDLAHIATHARNAEYNPRVRQFPHDAHLALIGPPHSRDLLLLSCVFESPRLRD